MTQAVDPWAAKTPDQILADVAWLADHMQRQSGPGSLVVPAETCIDLVRATVKDPYERLKLLWNLGCRGRDLR